jgi:hypothetical protein
MWAFDVTNELSQGNKTGWWGCLFVGVTKGGMTVSHFADREVGIKLNESVRGKHCYVVQVSSPSWTLHHAMLVLKTFAVTLSARPHSRRALPQ